MSLEEAENRREFYIKEAERYRKKVPTRFWNSSQPGFFRKNNELKIFKYSGIGQEDNFSYLAVVDFNACLGEGDNAKVYRMGAFSINAKKGVVTFIEEKAVKVFDIEQNGMSEVELEFEIGSKAPHLEMHPPVKAENDMLLVMNCIEGQSLYDLLGREERFLHYPVAWRVKFFLFTMLAIEKQVDGVGLVHRDLKPHNIMVVHRPTIKINIIDYGLSKEKSINDGCSPGSFLYAAPEIFDEDSQNQSFCDMFSIARVMSLLFIDDLSSFEQLLRTLDDCKRAIKSNIVALNCIINNKNSDQQSITVAKLLKKMLAVTPAKRPSIKTVIRRLERCLKKAERQQACSSTSSSPVLPAKKMTILPSPSLHKVSLLSPPSRGNLTFFDHADSQDGMSQRDIVRSHKMA